MILLLISLVRAYDALNDKNISVFRTGIERLTDTYTSIKRSYNYEVDKNYLDEVKESGFSHTFSDSFHYELRKFFRESVKSTEYSGEYFVNRCSFHCVYRKHRARVLPISDSFYSRFSGVWHVLNEWKAGLGAPLGQPS